MLLIDDSKFYHRKPFCSISMSPWAKETNFVGGCASLVFDVDCFVLLVVFFSGSLFLFQYSGVLRNCGYLQQNESWNRKSLMIILSLVTTITFCRSHDQEHHIKELHSPRLRKHSRTCLHNDHNHRSLDS